jgi:hypothetical protein
VENTRGALSVAQRRLEYAIVACILAVGWAFWLQRMGVNDHDDMLSNELIFARQAVGSLIFRIPWPDQSPLYFLYLRALRLAGESAFVVQFANAVLFSATLAATYRLALAFSNSRVAAGSAVLLGAISPTGLWLVRYGRMYSLQALFSVLASLSVLRYLERRRPRDLVAFALLSVLSIYTHFFAFAITALLFVPLIADAWLEARLPKPARSDGEWNPLVPPALAAASVLVLTLPQIFRLPALVTAGTPVRAEVSLPVLSPQFLDRVSWFWFVNADWGALRPGELLLTAVYIGSIALLAVVGLAAVRRRIGVTFAFWILLPVAGLGLAAARMDVRDRYFVWALPLIWTAVASGGFAALPPAWLTGARADVARGLRAALVVAAMAGSLWLLWHKLPERRPEGTKLMSAVAQLYRPSMRVYMPPSSAMGIPRLIALQRDLPAGLRDVRVLSAGTRQQFLQEVEDGEDFIFLLFGTPQNDEMRWRARYLQDHDYRKAVIPVFAASALIFTRQALDGWTESQRLGRDPSPEAVVAWARQQLRSRQTAAAPAPPLANAFVARVQPDGEARVGRLFISQHGEWGTWRLGPEEWNAVEDARVPSGLAEHNVIAAQGGEGSVLVVAFPAMPMKKSLDLFYGLADGAVARPGGSVEIGFYVNGERKSDLWSPNAGWKTFAADTSALDGQHADVVLLLTSEASRRFAFRLEPSTLAALASVDVPQSSGPIALTGGHRLSGAVDRLRVYRLGGQGRMDAQQDGRTYTAEDMHEAAGRQGEGGLRRVWALGALPWDGVGVTRQRSNGEPRDGLWAHPKNGTKLVIDAPAVHLGTLLRGHVGFTDFALDRGKAAGATAPVRFAVSIDGKRVFAREIARTAGWTSIAIPVEGPDTGRRLRIEISSASDAWAHFIFDLWSG